MPSGKAAASSGTCCHLHINASCSLWEHIALYPGMCVFACVCDDDDADCCLNIYGRLPRQPEKAEVVRTKRKYEKKPKIPPLSTPQHSGPSVFNPKDLNQYDFPSSDEEPYSQVSPLLSTLQLHFTVD